MQSLQWEMLLLLPGRAQVVFEQWLVFEHLELAMQSQFLLQVRLPLEEAPEVAMDLSLSVEPWLYKKRSSEVSSTAPRTILLQVMEGKTDSSRATKL